MLAHTGLMYPVLICFCTFPVLLYGSTEADEINWDLSRQWMEHALVSMDIIKSGFHREMVTTVEFGPELPNGLNALLSHRLPSGVYVDPYQLTSLGEDSDLQVLLNSTIDIEAPAHKSVGFTALVYKSLVGRGLKYTIPIHGRYHKPSLAQDNFELVKIALPKVMLKIDKCTQVPLLPSHNIVDAPCTASNISICQWLEIQPLQKKRQASLEMARGNGALVKPVCAGTLLVTLLCCVALSRTILRHGERTMLTLCVTSPY